MRTKGVSVLKIKNIYHLKLMYLNFMLFIFLSHGILYFLFPNDIYNVNSPIKYIKYIVIILFFLPVILKMKSKDFFSYVSIIVFILCFNIMAVGEKFQIFSIITIIIPISCLFFYNRVKDFIYEDRIITIIYIIMTIGCFYEYLFLKEELTQFSAMGYRCISIYINPNNFGLMINLLTSYLIVKKNFNINIKIFIFFLSFVLIILSGSRTSLVIYLFFTAYILLQKIFEKKTIKKKNLLILYFILFFFMIVLILIVVNIDKIDLIFSNTRIAKLNITEDGRVSMIKQFLNIAKENVLFPYKEGYVAMDNMYFYLWGTFGIIILILFIIINIIALFKAIELNKKLDVLWICIFFLYGFCGQFLYLWPAAYIYWVMIGRLLIKEV